MASEVRGSNVFIVEVTGEEVIGVEVFGVSEVEVSMVDVKGIEVRWDLDEIGVYVV